MSDYGSTPPPPPPPGGGGYDGGSTPPPPPSGGGYNGGAYGAPPPVGGTPSGPPPSNNLVLAILGLLCCWPIGIPAVVFAAQVNGKWNGGDQAGAVEAAAKAKKFAMIALVLGIIGTLIYVALMVAGVLSADTTTGM